MTQDNIGQWWTAPAEGENGGLVIVSGRSDIGAFRTNPRFGIRVEVSMNYTADSKGMPDRASAATLEQVHDRLTEAFRKDPVAVMTGVFTGEGLRDWVFYTLSTNIFGRKLNEALADMPVLPLTVRCENDPDWEAYDEMDSMRVDA